MSPVPCPCPCPCPCPDAECLLSAPAAAGSEGSRDRALGHTQYEYGTVVGAYATSVQQPGRSIRYISTRRVYHAAAVPQHRHSTTAQYCRARGRATVAKGPDGTRMPVSWPGFKLEVAKGSSGSSSDWYIFMLAPIGSDLRSGSAR
eukprot:2537405-Rhodomonas_salina.1